MTNAATALPDWVGVLISLGVAAALLALRAWIVSPWRGYPRSAIPERRRPLSSPTVIPSIEAVRPRTAPTRSSTGDMSLRQTRGPLVQLRPPERTQSSRPRAAARVGQEDARSGRQVSPK